MMLPRLRVSQMIFLVVYAALIGCAHQQSLQDRSRPAITNRARPVKTYRAATRGYVWVEHSEVTGPVFVRAQVWIERSSPADDSDASSIRPNGGISLAELEHLRRNTRMPTGWYILVPESAVREK